MELINLIFLEQRCPEYTQCVLENISECDSCIYEGICTWIEKSVDNSGSLCINFIDLDYTVEYGEDVWEEMAYRKYQEGAY